MTRETLPITKLYKTLVFIAIIIGPIYWLMFTDDGKRRTDTMVLWLAGGTSIDLNFRVLDSQFKPDDWKTVYPNVEWQCKDISSSLGSYLCHGEIASYNGIPARYLSVFFTRQMTSAVKLVYRDQYHQEIANDLLEQLGNPLNVTDISNNNILKWQTKNGLILLRKTLDRGEEATLMWVTAGADNNRQRKKS